MDKVSFEETKANARLIAAAPDLLEACEYVLHSIVCDADISNWQREIDIMVAAMAKAKGITPENFIKTLKF